MKRVYSIEDVNGNRITTESNLDDAIEYAKSDEEAYAIFEYNEDDTELINCVWSKREK